LPLINAMHAFVSSRYVVIEHVSLRRGGLLPTLQHEGLAGQPIEFGKPCRDVCKHRLHEHTSSGAADSDAVPLEPELAGQPHGLTSPVLEQFGDGSHVTSS
jgi:hypothetical protein